MSLASSLCRFIAELPNESELRVDFWNGARIKIYGSDNPDALRGRGFDMVVLDEYADMPPSLFPAVIRPALAEKNGRTIFIGTVRGRENHLWQTYQAAINDPDWYTDLLPASETGLIPEAELASARRDMGEDRYASEFECNSDSPIVGSYYGSLMRDADREGRVVPDLEIIDGPIHTAWDLGHGSNMAVFAFQIGDDGLLVHDFIQEDGWFFTNYIEAVKERGYTGKCYVPHDISRHLAKERIENIKPYIPLEKRFWPITENERNAIDPLVQNEAMHRLVTRGSRRGHDDDSDCWPASDLRCCWPFLCGATFETVW